MLVLTHVLIALASLAYTTYLFFRPSHTKLHISYSLVAATLASGIYLVFVTGEHILQACTTGLLYFGIVSLAIAAARNKLAKI